uniref:Aminotransferase class I/classII domain-containing protein n=1 Tax=Pinguiococcus pyrenoidosus TaxID=172671 RepID=A0A7R9U9T1_9STRA|mmetsp:Transcript_1989/g.8809  ORF Transcript_1989/g.8809 Transcript_1989/m.8809 type:complete len:433 (+) Transcript_1989:210-1508(+)
MRQSVILGTLYVVVAANAIKQASIPSLDASAERTTIKKDIKMPCPVPVEGQEEAMQLLQNGRLFRYNFKSAEESPVSQCEAAIAAYTGHNYCVALNSCGSALMLMLKATGVKPGDKVISNAFTFGAVPSAIEHVGGTPVYVESTMGYTMDLDDLRRKLAANPDCRHVLVSHMRGKVADMDKIAAICKEHGASLTEDCAHSLGVYIRGKHSGHAGRACAISSQSYKMINSGEGGFLLTDDPEVAARVAVYAGAYEGMMGKHLTLPPAEDFKYLTKELPNYSLRMSALSAAIIRPQVATLDERIAIYNARYEKLKKRLRRTCGGVLSIAEGTRGVTPVHDSIQFNLAEFVTEEQVQAFLKECHAHGLPVELFGAKSNGRNFVNWGFAPANDELPATRKMLARACDVRLPLQWQDSDFDDMAQVIEESLATVLGE